MTNENFRQELFNQFARVGKALSNHNRLKLLEFIAQGERSVEALAVVSGLTVGNTSQHLQHLRQAGLVASRKEGLHVYYHLSGDEVIGLVDALRNVAEKNLAGVERLVNTPLMKKKKKKKTSARARSNQGL